MKVKEIIFLLLLCLWSTVFSKSIQKFEMTTYDNRVLWGRSVDVRIILITYGKEKPAIPLLPRSSGYKVIDSTVSQSSFSATEIENGKEVEKECIYTQLNYNILFDKTGKTTVPSLYYSLDTDTVKAPAITFDVQRGSIETEFQDTSILMQYTFPKSAAPKDTLTLSAGDTVQMNLTFSYPRSFRVKFANSEIYKICKKLQTSTKGMPAEIMFQPQRIFYESEIRNGRVFYKTTSNFIVIAKSNGVVKIPSYSVSYLNERTFPNASKTPLFPIYVKEKSFSYSPELFIRVK